MDFVDDVVLIGHDGPHNINISNGKPILRKLEKYHGKVGSGVSVEFSLKNGPITLLSISLDEDGRFQFIVAQGESVVGEIPSTGNTNTRCKFDMSVRDFVKEWSVSGPTHHLALGVGYHADIIEKVANILGVNYKRIV